MCLQCSTTGFHGSPLHAVAALEDLCPRSSEAADFHDRLAADIELCGQGVEGPNKANVFKRTFYQMALKASIASSNDCAGFALVIPSAVWSSWRKHLGNPTLSRGDGIKHVLLAEGEDCAKQLTDCKSWIFVFDIDASSGVTPRPLIIKEMVAASSAALLEYGFERVARSVVEKNVVADYRKTLSRRVVSAWSGPPEPKKPTRTQRKPSAARTTKS